MNANKIALDNQSSHESLAKQHRRARLQRSFITSTTARQSSSTESTGRRRRQRSQSCDDEDHAGDHAAKRQKRRRCHSSATPYRRSRQRSPSFVSEIHLPCYKSYQLLGDSQLVRFTEQVQRMHHAVGILPETNSRYVNYCISGQRIEELMTRVKNARFPLKKKVIMMIGTNDMTYRTPMEMMEKHMHDLIKELQRKVEKLVLLTVPPVPKLKNDNDYWKRWRKLNRLLQSFGNDKNVFVVDFAAMFLSSDNKILEQYFEEYYGSSCRRDMIHLNFEGLKTLQTCLDKEYFDNNNNN